ncbi:erythromycin esterase family protein, partial [Acinetobacter baumannii]|uniref:erythromycin esterase family protein n=1 Tax=Acinetobacter baumannii TaxID=470 RepID=UPI0013A57211
GMIYLDYNIQAMSGFISGGGMQGDMGAKDKYMADSVLWHLKNPQSEQKVIVVAHNAHIQKTPSLYNGFLSCLPTGQRHKNAIGD